jgi:hypothetical protein
VVGRIHKLHVVVAVVQAIVEDAVVRASYQLQPACRSGGGRSRERRIVNGDVARVLKPRPSHDIVNGQSINLDVMHVDEIQGRCRATGDGRRLGLVAPENDWL